jgi:hypothetical protein
MAALQLQYQPSIKSQGVAMKDKKSQKIAEGITKKEIQVQRRGQVHVDHAVR